MGIFNTKERFRIFSKAFFPEIFSRLHIKWKCLMFNAFTVNPSLSALPLQHQGMVFDLILLKISFGWRNLRDSSHCSLKLKMIYTDFSFSIKTFVLFLSCWKSPLQMKLITLNKHWTTICYKSIVRQINFLNTFSNKLRVFSQCSVKSILFVYI